jgi:hypothetical protein
VQPCPARAGVWSGIESWEGVRVRPGYIGAQAAALRLAVVLAVAAYLPEQARVGGDLPGRSRHLLHYYYSSIIYYSTFQHGSKADGGLVEFQ